MKITELSKIKCFILGITAAIFLFAVIFIPSFLYLLSKNHVILPWDIRFKTIDLSDSGRDIDIYLGHKEVLFSYRGQLIWKSDEGLKVSDFLWEDIDRDEEEELVLLCWKKGRFGKHKPFWIEKDEDLWSQHIFIYEFNEEAKQIRPKWMASDIGFEVDDMYYEDNRIILVDKENKSTDWVWNGWGLVRCGDGPNATHMCTLPRTCVLCHAHVYFGLLSSL